MKWRCNVGDVRSEYRRTAVIVVLLAAALTPAKGQNVNAPVWSGVMLSGQEVQYFKYYNSSATEVATLLRPVLAVRPRLRNWRIRAARQRTTRRSAEPVPHGPPAKLLISRANQFIG